MAGKDATARSQEQVPDSQFDAEPKYHRTDFLRRTGWAVVDPEGRFDTDKLDGEAALHLIVDDDPMRPLVSSFLGGDLPVRKVALAGRPRGQEWELREPVL